MKQIALYQTDNSYSHEAIYSYRLIIYIITQFDLHHSVIADDSSGPITIELWGLEGTKISESLYNLSPGSKVLTSSEVPRLWKA